MFLSCEEGNITPWVPPQPKPTERDSVWGNYFPNSAGTEWEYNVIINSANSGIIKVKIEKRILLPDTVSASQWKYSGSNKTYWNYVAIVGDSVFYYNDIKDLKSATKIFKDYILPLDKFKYWDIRQLEQSFGSDKASGGSSIGSVTVPAGKFDDVYEIEHITDANDSKAHEWIYFVPGIGMIRRETLDISANITTVWELKSYFIKK